MSTATLAAANAARWSHATLLREAEFTTVAKRLIAAKARYAAVAERTGVPWFVIAVIHQRESSQDWSRSLAQGDPWNAVSTRVPKGRGPFASWEAAAVDALTACPPYAAAHRDWSIGGTLTLLERYNGLGYFNRGLPSPYLWAGTDQYAKGKYVRDGVFDANVVDKQLGCAGLLMAMARLDRSVAFSANGALAPAVVVASGAAAATAAAGAAQAVLPWPVAILVAAVAVGVVGYLVWRARRRA